MSVSPSERESVSTFQGRLYNPMIEPDRSIPELYYLWAARHAPVSWNPDLATWVVAEPSLVREVITDTERFSTSQALPFLTSQPEPIESILQGHRMSLSIMILDGDAHDEALPIWREILHGPRINAHQGKMRRIAASLADPLAGQEQVDLVSEFSLPYVENVVGELLGIPEEERHRLYLWAQDMLSYSNPLLGITERTEAARRHVELSAHLVQLFEQRRCTPGEDLISVMASLPLSREDYLMVLGTILAAGVGSTRLAINNAIQLMVENDWWLPAREEPGLIPALFEETLRRCPPQRGLIRTTTQDTTLGGVAMPTGTAVLPLIGAGNLDDGAFPFPLDFDPHRSRLREHLSFGGGLHACVAAHLARTMARIGLEELTRRISSPIIHAVDYCGSLIFFGPDEQCATVPR